MASAWLLSKVLYLRPFFQDLTRILITVFALVSIRIWMDENTFPAFGYILLHIPRKNWVTYTCYPKANIGSDGRKSKMHVGVLTTLWILMADSLKLCFATLTIKPILIFWWDKPVLHTNSGVLVFHIYEILAKKKCTKYPSHRPAESNEILWNLGTPKVAFRHDLITVSCADFWHTST